MLSPKQYGKLRLSASLLVVAALIFMACTAVGSIIAAGATRLPVSPVEDVITMDDIEKDASLRAFANLYRTRSGDPAFPKDVDGFLWGLSEYKALEKDSVTAPAAAATEGAANATEAVQDSSSSLENTVKAAEKTVSKSRMRQTLAAFDWYALLQAKIGEPLPPDQFAQVTAETLNGRTEDGNGLLSMAFTGSYFISYSAREKYDQVAQQYDWDVAENEPSYDRPVIKAPVWKTCVEVLLVLLALAGAYFALRFAETGRKLASVACGSVFVILGGGLAIVRFWEHLNVLLGFKTLEWQTLTGAAGYGAAILVVILFCVYTFLAHRAKPKALWLAALILGAIACLCLAARNVMPILTVMKQTSRMSSEASLAFILMNAGRLLLWVLTILGAVFGMRRVSDRGLNPVGTMFPALEAYRVNLRKERA